MANEFVIKNGYNSQGNSIVGGQLIISGNTGVGISSPTSKLHIVGTDSSTSNFGLKVDTSASTINNFSVRNDGFIDASQGYPVNSSNKKRRQLVVGSAILGDWIDASTYAYFGTAALDQTSNAGVYNYALLQYNDGETAINSSTGKVVTIRENNNPKYITFSNVSGDASMKFESGTNKRKIDYIDVAQGKIGVGLTNSNIQHYMTSGNSMTFNTGGNLQVDGVNELMRIQGNDGNVGINNTNPQAKLDVGGKIKSTTLQVTSGATAGYVLTSDASGNASWDSLLDSFYVQPSTTGVTWDLSGNSTNYKITLTGNTTLNLNNVRNGEYGTIILTQDATGSHSITFGTVNGSAATHKVINGGAGSVTLTATANAIDVLSFVYDGSNVYWNYGLNYN